METKPAETAVERKEPTNKALGGEWVVLSGVEYLLPPLNFDGLEELGPMIPKLSGSLDPENLRVFTLVTHRSLARAYPEMTEKDVKAILELPRLEALTNAIVRVNGFTTRRADDAGKPEASPT